MTMVRKKCNDLYSLKLAKVEMKSELRDSELRIAEEYKHLKKSFGFDSYDSSEGILSNISSVVFDAASRFAVKKLVSSKSTFLTAIGSILLKKILK